MRVVVGEHLGPVAPGELVELYPWPERGRWLRAMMVATLDGSPVGPDGRSRSISSPADREVLATTRRLADVVLIGAGTFRVERYRPMRARPEDESARAAAGLAAAPRLAIVSASLDLPWEEPAFAESTFRPIVVTTETAHGDRLTVAQQVADVIALPGVFVDPGAMLTALAERGLERVVCEGGPRLLGGIARAGLVDEADITLSPLFTGGGQLPTGTVLPAPSPFALAQVLVDDDGFLLTRYVATRTTRGVGEDEA
ncbi:MAG: dihydrofolate reductase family protein [Actinomycetales bacterium]